MKKIFAAICVIVLISSLNLAQAKKYSGYSTPEMMVGGELSIDLPVGSFNDGANTGFGIAGVFTYNVDDQLGITGNLGYHSFGTVASSVSVSDVPITAGVQYKFNTTSSFSPFIGAELGLHILTLSVFEGIGVPDQSFSTTKLGFTPMVGAIFPLKSSMNIRVALKYTLIFTEGSSTSYIGLCGNINFGLD